MALTFHHIHKNKSKQIKANQNKSRLCYTFELHALKMTNTSVFIARKGKQSNKRTPATDNGRKSLKNVSIGYIRWNWHGGEGSKKKQIERDGWPPTTRKLIFTRQSIGVNEEGSAIKHPIILSKFIFVYLSTQNCSIIMCILCASVCSFSIFALRGKRTNEQNSR